MMGSLPFAVFAAGLAFSAGMASDDAAAPPKFTCTLDKPKDECAFPTARDGVVLRITSESGIGGARLILTEGAAPSRLTIQFPNMKTLEAFAVGDGKVTLSGSLGSDASFDKQGKAVQDPKDAVYTLKIRKSKQDDHLIEVEATLPRSEPGTKDWRLTWIDAYRN
jgi:hypothetical protein